MVINVSKLIEAQESERNDKIMKSERAISEYEKDMDVEQAKPTTKLNAKRLARLMDKSRKELVKKEKLSSMITYEDYAEMRDNGYSHRDIKKIVALCT